MKLRDLFLTEFKIANQPDPTDREDYKAKMASLQDIQKGPRRNDARTQAHIAKRKEELRRWAEKNLKTEDNVQERMPASVIKSKQRYADMTDQELADRFKDSDEKTLRQMAWRHGYGNMSSHYFDRVQKGKSQTEDGVQATDLKRMGAEVKSLYVHKNGKTIMIPAERENDFIQKGYKRSALRTEDNMGFSDKEIKMAYGVLNNPKYKGGNMTGAVEVINKIAPGLADHPSVAKALQTTNEGSMVVDKTAFVQILANKIKEPQKGHGKPEYDNRLLAKMYKLITGADVDFEGDKFTINVRKPQTETAVEEGASMIPYYKTEKDWDGEKRVVWEFPKTWANDKELDTPYMSNASMRQFLQALGYPADFEDMSAVPVEEFIGVTTQWLKKNIGKQSPEEEPTVDKNPGGPTMISGGRPEGYMNRQVKLHNELARKIKQKYPEVTHLGFN